MPNLKEKMNQKRKDAINASDQQIAEYIWGLVEELFDMKEGYVLEVFDYISVALTEKVNGLKVQFIIKESEEIKEDTSDMGRITLSFEKLERIDYIMPLVMKLAKKEGVTSWEDVNDAQEKFWGFYMGFKEEDE